MTSAQLAAQELRQVVHARLWRRRLAETAVALTVGAIFGTLFAIGFVLTTQ